MGFQAVNSAKLRAVKKATTPAIIMDVTIAEPARPATMPVTTKIPPPMIAPTLMATALQSPMERLSLCGFPVGYPLKNH